MTLRLPYTDIDRFADSVTLISGTVILSSPYKCIPKMKYRLPTRILSLMPTVMFTAEVTYLINCLMEMPVSGKLQLLS
ncbi:hypothetical protein T07_9032 [Trichinella nelsoni]|uniref:Uncharacterized protein n=1 Tax=Trichinella nelsoni TaxID=6336 RepID=A0A0V0S0T7_9BILA|nr:hypothetical protein T07_9032 [Trichinella nelsoni]